MRLERALLWFTAMAVAVASCALITSATEAQGHGDRLRPFVDRIEQWRNGWNNHDATALGSLLDRDVDFVLVNGIHLQGRKAFVEAHAKQFAGRYARSLFAIDGAPKVSLIRHDVAIVIWRWTISGVQTEDGQAGVDYHGIFTWTMERADGAWRIRSAQNTIDK